MQVQAQAQARGRVQARAEVQEPGWLQALEGRFLEMAQTPFYQDPAQGAAQEQIPSQVLEQALFLAVAQELVPVRA
jgi:hypothetical protein